MSVSYTDEYQQLRLTVKGAYYIFTITEKKLSLSDVYCWRKLEINGIALLRNQTPEECFSHVCSVKTELLINLDSCRYFGIWVQMWSMHSSLAEIFVL